MFATRYLDSTADDFIPWWKRVDEDEFVLRLNRYRRALYFCKGRAADLRPHLQKFIRFLERYQERHFL